MKHTTRSACLALSLSALTGAASAQVSTLPDALQLSCDNTLTQLDGPDLSLRCAGNLTLQGLQGDITLQRSGSITLEAAQDLSLSGVSLVAPSITLTTIGGRLLLAPDVVLNSSGAITLNSPTNISGDLEVHLPTPGNVVVLDRLPLPSGSVTVSAVPEPATGLMGLMGAALALAWAFARGQHGRRP